MTFLGLCINVFLELEADMGKLERPLPQGRVFEKEIFGFTDESEPDIYFRMPSRRGTEQSIQDIVQQNWAMFSEAVESGQTEYHNPSRPQLGKTEVIWRAVKKYLPRRTRGSTSMPLQLFIAVGKNSLDWRHGVDAIFWWSGVFVTIDVSIRPKDALGKLKADFVLTPKDLKDEELKAFGQKVANLLKLRRRNVRENKIRNKEKPVFIE